MNEYSQWIDPRTITGNHELFSLGGEFNPYPPSYQAEAYPGSVPPPTPPIPPTSTPNPPPQPQPQETDGDWAIEAAALLQQIAALEIAGVCMYALYSVTLSGLAGEAVRGMFEDSRDESLVHYGKATLFLLSLPEGRKYVTANPSAEEMNIPMAYGDQGTSAALNKAIDHETRALECYKQLKRVAEMGDNQPLLDWATEQCQTEYLDLQEFKRAAGQI